MTRREWNRGTLEIFNSSIMFYPISTIDLNKLTGQSLGPSVIIFFNFFFIFLCYEPTKKLRYRKLTQSALRQNKK